MMNNAAADTCLTCDTKIERIPLVGGICPACLLNAARPPTETGLGRGHGHGHGHGDTVSADSRTTTWSHVFPQFCIKEVIRETEGFLAMVGELSGEEPAPADAFDVLLIWTKDALSGIGKQEVVISMLQRLSALAIPGIVPILDVGSVEDAAYCIVRVPAPGCSLADRLVSGDADTAIGKVLRDLGGLAIDVRQRVGATLTFDPALLFFDDADRISVVPVPELEKGALSPSELLPKAAHTGQCVGPYVLERKLGEGGFGDVWLGQQTKPIERTVAIKILKHIAASPRTRARFEVEQQALARLKHPGIADLYESGVLPDGRPFFAMEWVDGLSMTHYCENELLTIDERLHLFTEVCEAVQHAHQKGIIHRDIKPSNVMVTAQSGRPKVKVIDFGIARGIDEPLAERTLITRADEIIGTPASMSPEQAAGARGAELDARSDVYSLGVLLYELLTGEMPFDPKMPPDELRRCIRDSEPQKPSLRAEASRSRQIRGDLDWVVMRCLEKEASRRYPSVSALKCDIDRHLKDEPVEAGPPDTAYRMRKFARRHRMGLAAALIVLVALIAGGSAALFGFLRAQQEREQAIVAREDAQRETRIADAVSRFLSEELLTLEEPDGLFVPAPRNKDIQLRTVLKRAAERMEGQFDNLPEVEGILRRSLATSFLAIGDLDGAKQHAELALKLMTATFKLSDARTLSIMRLLASIQALRGETQAAQELLDQIAHETGKHPGKLPSQQLAAEVAIVRGDLLLERGKIVTAAEAYDEALAANVLPPVMRASALSGKALTLEQTDGREIALSKHREAMDYATAELGKEHAVRLEIVRRYARFVEQSDDGDDATEFAHLLQMTNTIQVRTLGMDHPSTLRTRFDYFFAIGTVPHLADGATTRLQAVVTAAAEIYPADHPELLRFQLGLAIQQGRNKKHQEAITLLESIIESGLRSEGEEHPVVVDATRELAMAYRILGDSEKALALQHKAVERARTGLSAAAESRRRAELDLGDALRSENRIPEAIGVYRDAYVACTQELGATHQHVAAYLDQMLLTFLYDRTGAAAEALAELALRRGGTPLPVIRSQLQLSLASQLCLRPSFFAQSPVPLPNAYLRLLEVNEVFHEDNEAIPNVIGDTSDWRYTVLAEGEQAPANWVEAEFDDAAWPSGRGPIGFGEPDVVTEIRRGDNDKRQPVSVCLRHRFHVRDMRNTDSGDGNGKPLLIRLRCDDGALVLLNGKELLRVNLADGLLDATSRALRPIALTEEQATRAYLVPSDALLPGENLLAARVFQHTVSSSDLFFSMTLQTDAPLPMELLEDLDPQSAYEQLDAWLPGLVIPLESDWKTQIMCMTTAMLGGWEEALTVSQGLSTERLPESSARLQWFQRVALTNLGRAEEAEAIFRQAIPRRDGLAKEDHIDLTDHYNARFDEAWHVTNEGFVHEPFFKDFPVGTREFDGIRFDARGLIQLSSLGLEQANCARRYPREVTGIPIGQLVGKIHLLNGTLQNSDEDETVATMVIHYDDGTEEEVPIRYWHDTLTSYVGRDEAPETVRTGWRGPDPFRPGSDKAIFIFIATWENQRPDTVISSIDFRAGATKAALFVCGVTVESP